jgi:hypothetical protein
VRLTQSAVEEAADFIGARSAALRVLWPTARAIAYSAPFTRPGVLRRTHPQVSAAPALLVNSVTLP